MTNYAGLNGADYEAVGVSVDCKVLSNPSFLILTQATKPVGNKKFDSAPYLREQSTPNVVGFSCNTELFAPGRVVNK